MFQMKKVFAVLRSKCDHWIFNRNRGISSIERADFRGNKSTKDFLFNPYSKPVQVSKDKVSIIGTGDVGVATAVCLLEQNVTRELAFFDRNEKRVKGEVMDLQHGSQFLNNAKIQGSTDIEVTARSRICIITTATGQADKEKNSRLNLIQRNVDILKEVMPTVIKYSPDAIILIVSNPVDVLTYACGKRLNIAKNKIIGSGCNLDSARLRFLMSQRYGVSPSGCKGWILGEHGDSSVAAWSTFSIGGVRLQEINPDIGTDRDPEKWTEVHKEVVSGSYNMSTFHGSSSWAIALSISDIVDCVLRNTRKVFAVSVPVKGYYGISQDVYFSLPSVLGEDGVSEILTIPLPSNEKKALHLSACLLHDLQKKIKC